MNQVQNDIYKSSFIITILYGVSGVVLTPVITFLTVKLLGSTDYGRYALLERSTVLISMTLVSSFSAIAVRYISYFKSSNNRHITSRIIQYVIWYGMGLGMLLALIVVGFADFISTDLFHRPDLAYLLRVFSMYIPLSVLLEILLSSLRGSNFVVQSSFISSVLLPLQRLSSLCLCFIFDLGIEVVITGLVTSCLISVIYASYLVFKNELLDISNLPKYEFNKTTLNEIKKFGVVIFIDSIFITLYENADILILAFFDNKDAAIGAYATSIKLSSLISLGLNAASAVFFPAASSLYAQNDYRGLEVAYKSANRWSLFFALPSGFVLYHYGEVLLNLLGRDFSSGYDSLILLTISSVFYASCGIGSAIIGAAGKVSINLMNAVFISMLRLVLSFWLIQIYGIYGAAISICITSILFKVIQITQVKYIFNFFPQSKSSLMSIWVVIFSIIFTLIFERVYLPNTSFQFIICIVLFLCFYLTGIYFFGLSKEDHILLTSIMRKYFYYAK